MGFDIGAAFRSLGVQLAAFSEREEERKRRKEVMELAQADDRRADEAAGRDKQRLESDLRRDAMSELENLAPGINTQGLKPMHVMTNPMQVGGGMISGLVRETTAPGIQSPYTTLQRAEPRVDQESGLNTLLGPVIARLGGPEATLRAIEGVKSTQAAEDERTVALAGKTATARAEGDRNEFFKNELGADPTTPHGQKLISDWQKRVRMMSEMDVEYAQKRIEDLDLRIAEGKRALAKGAKSESKPTDEEIEQATREAARRLQEEAGNLMTRANAAGQPIGYAQAVVLAGDKLEKMYPNLHLPVSRAVRSSLSVALGEYKDPNAPTDKKNYATTTHEMTDPQPDQEVYMRTRNPVERGKPAKKRGGLSEALNLLTDFSAFDDTTDKERRGNRIR